MEKAKELEKAARLISKWQDSSTIPMEKPQRVAILRAALENDLGLLTALVDEIASLDDGTKFLMRALNNCMPLANEMALGLAKILYLAAGELDLSFRLKKLSQLLESASSDLKALGWLLEESTKVLDELADKTDDSETYLELLSCLVAASLRTTADADELIRELGHLRLLEVKRSQIKHLSDSVWKKELAWDKRAAAVFLLFPLKVLPIDLIHKFIDEAYVQFPLEALQGIEALSIAIEYEASVHYEENFIRDRVAQLRVEGLSFDKMQSSSFEKFSRLLFNDSALPATAYEAALSFSNLPPQEALILSIFISDDQARNWMKHAQNTKVFKALSIDFLENLQPSKRIALDFSQNLVQSLLEENHINAKTAAQFSSALGEGEETAITNAIDCLVSSLKQ